MMHDAAIIGAGPAGSTAALLLARAGWSVALIEKSAFPRAKVCGEFVSAPGLALLARLGVADDILSEAGPEVREVGVYAGDCVAAAPMPRTTGAIGYGRALGRDRLDTVLLERARAAGAAVYQPCREPVPARIVIAAHGTRPEGAHRPSDLLAFKARFRHAALPAGRMPLLAFPGGYGGLVHSDRGEVSFSCCIRRDALAACRARVPGEPAGEAVLAHVLRSCRGAREVLSDAERIGPWLAAGPLRPGIHAGCRDDYFPIGNAFGEAHPIVAEGIGMAIQSASILCEYLVAGRPDAAGLYEKAWRANFRMRMAAASLFAALAMRPRAAGVAAALLAGVPGLLGFGARCAGKARPLGGVAARL